MEQKRGRMWVPSVIRAGSVALAALLFGLGFGLNYGASNQNTYLIGGLHLLHPGLLANDWLTTQTTSYHRVFAYPVAALYWLDSSGWLFAAVNVVVLAVGAAVIFALIRAVWGETGGAGASGGIGATPTVDGGGAIAGPRFATGLLALCLVLLPILATRALSVADSTLYTLEFEPATLGVTGLLVGMCLFVRRRYLLSGLAVAAGGLFHANYLILSFPVFLLAHLLVQMPEGGAPRRRAVWLPLLRQFAFPIVALLALLPIIVPIALQPGSAGTSILLSIRSPHHYEPLTFRDQFIPFLGWLLVFAAGLRRRDAGRRGLSPSAALATGMTVLILLASALTTVVYIPSVAQLYVWRLAPVVVLLAQIYSARMVAGAVTEGEGHGRWLLPTGLRVLSLIVAAECFFDYYYLHHRDWLVLETLGGIALLGLGAWAARGLLARAHAAHAAHPGGLGRAGARRRAPAATGIVVAAGLALALMTQHDLRTYSNLLAPATPEDQLYSWARADTDPAAVFLVPPDMDRFRLASERAVVVDWKSTPFTPSELEKWYQRIDALSGGTRPRTEAKAAAAYAALGATQLAGLADDYAASYVVERAPAAGAPPGWLLVFDNGRYRVFRTQVAAPTG